MRAFYRETVSSVKLIESLSIIPIAVPTAVSCYSSAGMCSPKNLLSDRMPNLIHYVDMDVGGHFAAFETPVTFHKDLVDLSLKFFDKLETKDNLIKKSDEVFNSIPVFVEKQTIAEELNMKVPAESFSNVNERNSNDELDFKKLSTTAPILAKKSHKNVAK